MKRYLITGFVPLMVVAVVVLSAKQSSAIPILCNEGTERVSLTPTGAVTYDGFILQRSSIDGRFHTDGGLDFDVGTNDVQAVDAVELVTTACTASATTVTLTVTDPFTGVRSMVGAVAP